MKIKIIVIFVVTVLFILIEKPFEHFDSETSNQLSYCREKERARDQSFNGDLKDKYLDSQNHNYRTIVIRTDSGLKKSWFLTMEQSGVFDKLNIGDSIVKEKGQLTITINSINFNLKYDCKRSKNHE